MSFTVFLGNLPAWVTADDIRGWLSAENLVADAIKVIRNPETQESKGFAFIRCAEYGRNEFHHPAFDRAPLEDRLLRANPAQPPKPRGQGRGPDRPSDRPAERSSDRGGDRFASATCSDEQRASYGRSGPASAASWKKERSEKVRQRGPE